MTTNDDDLLIHELAPGATATDGALACMKEGFLIPAAQGKGHPLQGVFELPDGPVVGNGRGTVVRVRLFKERNILVFGNL